MPAPGGLKKAELDISATPPRPPIIRGSEIAPFVKPVSPLVKCLSYVALWKNPQLSAYTFIWLNLCILCRSLLGLTAPLTSTFVLGLLTVNLLLAEYAVTGSRVTCHLLVGALGMTDTDLRELPGSDQVCESVVSMVNTVAGVFLNIRDTSTQGKTQFYFALCTTVAMVTIVLSYLASTTTLLIVFWGTFCLPAIKYNELHKKVTKEEIVAVFNMSLCMLYNLYTALTSEPLPAPPTATIQDLNEDGEITLDGGDPSTVAPPVSYRSATMSYLRGLPSSLTWGAGTGTLSRWWHGPTSPSPVVTESTESDSDFGIDDLPAEERPAARVVAGGGVDTLVSGLTFPTLDSVATAADDSLVEGLDPALLYDEDRSFTLGTEGGGGFSLGTLGEEGEFTLGTAQSQHLLEAVEEDEEDDEVERDGPPRIIRSGHISQDDSLERSQPYMMDPHPPATPKPAASVVSPHRQVSVDGGASNTDSENFYVISDEDILAAAEEEESSLASSPGGNPMI